MPCVLLAGPCLDRYWSKSGNLTSELRNENIPRRPEQTDGGSRGVRGIVSLVSCLLCSQKHGDHAVVISSGWLPKLQRQLDVAGSI